MSLNSAFRIVQIHSYDGGGGAERVVSLNHKELRRLGYHSRLLVARKKGDAEGVEEVSYVRGPKGLRRLARWTEKITGRQYIYSPSFRQLLRELPKSADIVHIHSMHGAEGYADLSQIAWLSTQVPLVLSVHDLWLLSGHCAYPLDCDRWLVGCGQCPDLKRYPAIPCDGTKANWRNKKHVFSDARVQLIAPSQWVIDQVKKSPILNHLPIHLVYNPVDTAIFFPKERQIARQALGLPQDHKIILMVAQSLANFYKGVPDGLDALNQLADSSEIFVVIIGRDAEHALKDCKLPGRAVPYQADQSDLVNFYRAADVFLMPSRCETFGMVAAEAMACGTPVVAYAAGGLVDVLGDDEGGFLVPSGDIQGLVKALNKLLLDEQLNLQKSHLAVTRASSHFSLKAHTQVCLSVYNHVTHSPKELHKSH